MSKLTLKSLFEKIHGRLFIGVMLLSLFVFSGTALSWQMPDVEITTPENGDAVSGIVAVSVNYSVSNGNIHTLQLRIDGVTVQSVAVHQQSGSHIFNWDSSSIVAGPHIIEVRAYSAAPPSDHFNTDSINVNVFNAVCDLDTDCDDENEHTADVCMNPGTPDAVCEHEPIECLNDGECDDENTLTIDACDNPGTADASCSHTVIVCNVDNDCNDADPYSLDACENGGTEQSACIHVPITCLNDEDCNDENLLTLDDCANSGTPDSDCLHTPFECNTNADCHDGDLHTDDACQNGGTVQSVCAHDTITCLSDSECDDDNGLTLNSCLNPGTTAAACSYTPIACNTNTDCNDDNAYTADTCAHGGTMTAACSHEAIECVSDTDCNDENALTLDSCSEAGSVLSMCAHVLFACNTNADCDDSNAATDDICENGGTSEASCTHGDIACMDNSDCDDGDTLTLDSCTAAGTTDAACAHDPLSCAADSDCNDDNTLTIDACSHPGTSQSACEHTSIACNTASDCDDENTLTLDTCEHPGTAQSTCGHTAISCNTDDDCNDNDSATTDTCEHPGTVQSACSHTPVEEEPEPESESLSLVVTTPVDGLITNQTEMSVTGTTTPGALVTVNDLAVGVDASGAYIKGIPLIEGTNTIDVTACLADDCVSETRSLVVDTVAPEVGVAALEENSIYVLLSDNPGGSGLDFDVVNVSLDGDAATWIYDQTRKALRIDAGTLEPGTHAVTVSATDLAGNAVQRTVTFEAGESSGLRIEILDVPGRVIEEETGMLMGFTLPEPQTQGWNIPNITNNSAQEFQDLLDEWYKKHTSGWPEGAFDFNKSKHEKLEIPSVECADVTANAPDIASETLELAVDGYVVAEVIPVASDVDESSIEVRIDGAVVPHEYDKKTKKIKAHVKGLKRGNHTAEVTAADTLGSTGTATTAFGVDPNILSMHLDNVNNPGSGHIASGQQFKVTLTMDEADFTGAWIILHNPDNASPSIGDGQIGQRYYIAATQPGSFDYETIGYFYTSIDQTGQSATRIEAGIPLNDPPTTYLFASETLIIDNPPVSPTFWNAQFENLSTSSPNAFRLNDNYRVTANGSQGVQNVIDMLLNFDTVAVGGNPSIASIKTDSMVETPYGSGMYETTSGSAMLDNLMDGTGASARVLLPLVCAPGSGENACAFGSLVYMDTAPVFNNIVLQNVSAPGEPFTQPGQEYKVTVYGDVVTPHLPYLQTLLMNADRIVGGFENIDPTMAPMLMLTQISPGVYEATGILDDFIDNDGQTSNRVVAAVTVASFFEYTLSNQIEIQQQPPQIEITSVHIRNKTYPDRATVTVGEEFEVISEADPGLTLTCQVFGVRINGSGNGAVTTLPMTETSSGHYTCSGTVSIRPDVEGLPADLLTAAVDTGIPGVHGRNSDDFLTYRGTIIEAHLSNASRPDATDIAPGEKIKIIAIATPGLGSINGGLLDARIHNSPLPGGPFLQTTDPLVEYPIESGQYSVEAVLLSVPEGLTTIRGYVGNIASDDPLIVVLTTETLNILAAPPISPTTITTIDSMTVSNNEATSSNLAPVIEGTAPASATVNIYELIPGGTIGMLEPVTGSPALSAVFAPGVGTYGDDFNGADWSSNWMVGDNTGPWTLTEQSGHLSMQLGPASMVVIDGNRWNNDYTNQVSLALDVTFPAIGNPPLDSVQSTVNLGTRLINGITATDYHLTLETGIQPSGQSSIQLRTQNEQCSTAIPALSHDTIYRIEMTFDESTPSMIARINGNDVLTCPLGTTPSGRIDLVQIVGQNFSTTQSIHIDLDNYDTGIPIPSAYTISGPAMMLNGMNYNSFGPSGLFLTPCNGTKPDNMPATTDCLSADKDIHVFAVRLFELRMEDTIIPELPLTLFTAGGTDTIANDQLDYIMEFMKALEQENILTGGYSIDGQGIALYHPANGWGNSYTPAVTPIPAQLPICGEQPGADGYLRWDAGTSQYLGSNTPLAHNGTTYSDAVMWGFFENSDAPNIVTGSNTPVWWANGSDNITAAVASATDNGNLIHATIYATPGLIIQLPPFVHIDSEAPGALTANNFENDYDWNAAALATAGISPAPISVCNGYGRNLIATTTAAANNAYATQTISLRTYTDHLLYADSIDTGTGSPLGHSAITTYHIQQATGTVDTTPPQIAFTSHMDGQLISNAQPIITATVTDTETGVDWNSLSCQTSPSAIPCNANHSSGDNVEITFETAMPDGNNTISLTAADRASIPNTTSANLTLDIDATPPVITNVNVEPDLFNPNVRSTTITANILDVHLNGWYLYIYNESNDAVQHIEGSGTNVSFTWDGKNEAGNLQPDGVYTIIIGTADTLGNIATEATASIIIDTTPPDITILDPVDGAWVSPALYTVRVQATDLNGIDAVRILLNGIAQGNATYVGNNIYEFPMNFSYDRGLDHIITAVATDSAANSATTTSGIHIPNNTISIESITFVNLTRQGATDIAIGESFKVVVTASRKQAIPSLRIINTDRWSTETGPGVDIAHQITIIDDKNSKTTFEGVLLACADNDGQPATRIAAIGSVDGFTTASLSGSLNILTCAPQPPEPPVITEPDNGDTTRDATPTVRGNAQPGFKVYIYLENTFGGSDTLIATVDTVPDNGRFATDTIDLGISGSKTIYAIAEKEVLGTILQSTPSNTVTFTLRDTEKPIIISHTAVPNPFSPGASPLSNDDTTISAEAVDDNLVSWRIRIFDANGTRMINAEGTFTNPIPDQPTPFSYKWDGYRVKNNGQRILQPEGVYTYEILVWDDKRKSDPATGTIIIDNTAPTVAITDPIDNALIGGIQYKVQTTANDTQGIATIDIYIDGDWHNSAVPTDCGSGGTKGNGCSGGESQWTAILAPKVVGDGLHTLSAVARDIAGNPSTHTINILIDTVAPNPPENLTAQNNGDGTVTLLWTPPTTNEDGSPLTDLESFLIYSGDLINHCEYLYPFEAAVQNVCLLNSQTNLYNITGNALIYAQTPYENNPYGGPAAWFDDDTGSLYPMPLVESNLVKEHKTVFVFLMDLEFTNQSGGFDAGIYRFTVYTQATEEGMLQWMTSLAKANLIIPENSRIAAYAPACEPVGTPHNLGAIAFPLKSIPRINYTLFSPKIQAGTTTYSFDISLLSEMLLFRAVAADIPGNHSSMSNATESK